MNNIISNIWYLYKWFAFKRRVQFFFNSYIFYFCFDNGNDCSRIGSTFCKVINSESVFGSSFIIYLEKLFQITNRSDLVMTLAIVFVGFAILTGICRSILIYIISYFSNVVLAEVSIVRN